MYESQVLKAAKVASHPLEAIIKAGGVVGLIAVMGMGFLMIVVYRGQESMQMVHMQMLDLANQQLTEQKKDTEILTDIRYTIKANNGISFRNNASIN